MFAGVILLERCLIFGDGFMMQMQKKKFHFWDKVYSFSSSLLPWEANVATYRFMGGDKCMLPFIKNIEMKTSNGHTKLC